MWLYVTVAVVLMFGASVFVHELGHFWMARRRGMKVEAFAIGFGPSLVSYRKGLGFRSGSSEKEYIESARASDDKALALSPPYLTHPSTTEQFDEPPSTEFGGSLIVIVVGYLTILLHGSFVSILVISLRWRSRVRSSMPQSVSLDARSLRSGSRRGPS